MRRGGKRHELQYRCLILKRATISLLNSETSDDNVTQSVRQKKKKKSEVKIGERAFFVQLEL